MAFFKFRWLGEREQGDASSVRSRVTPTESIELMRRRARHRLIGAAVLVLAGVLGFPLLFDTQPRPIPVDIPIEIPDRNKVAPLVVPSAPTAEVPVAKAPVNPLSIPVPPPGFLGKPPAPVPPVAGIVDGEELVSTSRPPVPVPVSVPVPAPKPEPKPAPKPEPKPEPKSVLAPPKPEAKPVTSHAKPEPKPEHNSQPEPKTAERKTAADEAARAKALLEGVALSAKPVERADRHEGEKAIVQVGAFADAEKAREVRSKLERAGLKAYTQVVETKEGKRTRVRVGPFASRAEADKAAVKVRALDLSASVVPQ